MDLIAGRPSPIFKHPRRSKQTEVLDGPVETGELAVILSDLARFNGAMLGRWLVIRWLRQALHRLPPGQPVTLLDIGCGHGDLLRAVRHWAQKSGRQIKLTGIDLNPQVIGIARANTDGSDAIEYCATDVFDYKPPHSIDIVTTSLVAHHLTDAMIVRLLRWLEANAQKGWLICDLRRSIVPFYFIALAGRLLRLHPVITYDGRVSVARSLTRKEWRECVLAAGIASSALDIRSFMFRFMIGRMK
jgi:2-polyprenyl-3-methyl-5-hydroxy-6-metoxy-1,4-benzoquinol methylase